MSKNLTKEEWLKVIKIYLELGASEASNEYLKIKDKPLSRKYLKLRIRYKLNLLDNKGIEILKRRPGSGGPSNKIESDIPRYHWWFNRRKQKRNYRTMNKRAKGKRK